MSSYVVNPADPTTPLDSQPARQGAEELRALKAYLAGLIGLPSGNGVLSGFRNRIINGCCRFDQIKEGAAATVPTVSQHLDQFSSSGTGGGQFTVQREQGGLYTGEFNQLLTVTVADAALAAGDLYNVYTTIEGYNFADFLYGTAGALTGTLSFEVKSSIVGTFGVFFLNSAFNRSYIGTFTVNAANTVERKTITVPGDIAGAWLTTNGIGMTLGICLASGATFQTAAGVWTAGGFETTNAQTNWMATGGNTFRIGRIQFEQSAAATPFERRSQQTELSLIQRYYWKTFDQGQAVTQGPVSDSGSFSYFALVNGIVPYSMNFRHPVQMRAIPSMTAYSPGGASGNFYNATAAANSGAGTFQRIGTCGGLIDNPQAAGDVQTHFLTCHASANARLS